MDNYELHKAVDMFGTPTYIFDIKKLTYRIKKIKDVLGENIQLCYSIKANPFIVAEIDQYVDKLEVCSSGELDICAGIDKHDYQINMNKILFSGVNKMVDEVEKAYEYGVREYTAESIKQVEMLQKIAENHRTFLPVYLRLSSGNQFGMSKEDILYVVENRKKYSGLNILGLHYYAGTQRKSEKCEKQKKDFTMLRELYDEIELKYGIRFESLEYGPGLYVPLFENDDFSNTLDPLDNICQQLHEAAQWVKITLEMGRFITSECGYYITKIVDKKNTYKTDYIIVDGGKHHVNYYGQIMGMRTPIVMVLDEKNDLNQITEGDVKCSVCGSLCTSGDILFTKKVSEHMEIGEVLVFLNVGAYSVTEAMSLFLSRKMPQIVLFYGDNSWNKVRPFIDTSVLNRPQYEKK